MISGETMQCRKVSQILRYHVQINFKLEKNLLIMCYFCLIRSGMYQNKLGEQGAQAVENMNKMQNKF